MRNSDGRRRVAAVVCLLALLLSACVSRQRREMVESRDAYQACVRDHPTTHRDTCAELEAETITRQERYRDDAARAWGCGGTSNPDCDPRERTPQQR